MDRPARPCVWMWSMSRSRSPSIQTSGSFFYHKDGMSCAIGIPGHTPQLVTFCESVVFEFFSVYDRVWWWRRFCSEIEGSRD